MKSQSNLRNYFLGLTSGLLLNIVTSILGFVSVPIALAYWKIEPYGLWLIINSVVVYLNMSNLGLNAAANNIIARNNDTEIKFVVLERSLKTLLFSLLAFSFILYIISIFFPNWVSILGNIPKELISEAKSAIFYSIVSFFINSPFSLISFSPFNKYHIDKYYDTGTVILSFGGLLLTIALGGTITYYVIVLLFIKLVINLIKTVHFVFETGYLNVRKNLYSKDSVDLKYKTIIKTGLTFFGAGIASLMVWNVDNFVISNYLDLRSVTIYNITYKLFFIVFSFIQLFINPMVYIIAKEFGNKNWILINTYYNRTLVLISFISGGAWITSMLFFRDIITIWVGLDNFGGLTVVFFLGAYTFFLGLSYLNYSTLAILGYIKQLPIIILVEGIINLGLGIIFVQSYGIVGMAMSRFLCNFLWISWIYPFLLFKGSKGKLIPNYFYIAKKIFFVLLPLSVLSIYVSKIIENQIIFSLIAFSIIIVYVILGYYSSPKVIRGYIKDKMNYDVRKLI